VALERKTLDSRFRGNDGTMGPREGGDPVALERKTLDSRFRGNDGTMGPRERGDPVTCERKTLDSRDPVPAKAGSGNDGTMNHSRFRGNEGRMNHPA
jgi:hypothetical protein